MRRSPLTRITSSIGNALVVDARKSHKGIPEAPTSACDLVCAETGEPLGETKRLQGIFPAGVYNPTALARSYHNGFCTSAGVPPTALRSIWVCGIG